MSKRWHTAMSFGPEKFPAEPACYIVLCDPEPEGPYDRVLYVGQSLNLRVRMGQHDLRAPRTRPHWDNPPGFTSTPWGVFYNVRVKYRPAVKFGDWAMMELRLIRRLLPRFNSCCFSKRVRREGGA